MKQRVWDLPTRLFHWALVLLVGLSWWTAETGRDSLHLWFGYGVLFLLAFRILWGFLGSSTARFSAFIRGPRAVAEYVRNVTVKIGESAVMLKQLLENKTQREQMSKTAFARWKEKYSWEVMVRTLEDLYIRIGTR